MVSEGLRAMERWPFIALCALLFRVIAAAQTGDAPADSSAVIAELRLLEETYGGRLGLMAKDLRTGRVVRYNDRERFPTASLIKLPVMGAAFDLA
ncbi:hypothetical protein EG829_27730, partial [bacterium]|nr:hypothetical protein [bacterium]